MARINDDRTVKVFQIFANIDGINRILDCGCNDGNISLVLGDLTKSDFYAIDADPQAIQSARDKGINVLNVDVDYEEFPFEKDFFDAIYCGEVIEHLLNPDHLLAEIYRTLKPGGIGVIDTPNLSSWHGRISLLLGYQPSYTQVSNKYNVGKIYHGKKMDSRNITSSQVDLYA